MARPICGGRSIRHRSGGSGHLEGGRSRDGFVCPRQLAADLHVLEVLQRRLESQQVPRGGLVLLRVSALRLRSEVNNFEK